MRRLVLLLAVILALPAHAEIRIVPKETVRAVLRRDTPADVSEALSALRDKDCAHRDAHPDLGQLADLMAEKSARSGMPPPTFDTRCWDALGLERPTP